MRLIIRIVIVLALFTGLGVLIGVEREDLTSENIGAQIDAAGERAASLLSLGETTLPETGGGAVEAEASPAPSMIDTMRREGLNGVTGQIAAEALRQACDAAKARGEPEAAACAPPAGPEAQPRHSSDPWGTFDADNKRAFMDRIARERGADPVTPPQNAAAAAEAAAPYAVERLRPLIAAGLAGDEAAWMELLRLYEAATPEQRIRINRLEAAEKARAQP